MDNKATDKQYYVFVASDSFNLAGGMTFSIEVIADRLRKGWWPLGELTRYRRRLQPGDKAIFYAAGSQRLYSFTGCATIASESSTVDRRYKSNLLRDYDALQGMNFGVILDDIEIFARPVPVKPLLSELTFTKPIPKWGSFFRGGVIRITRGDYNLIRSLSAEV